MKCILCLTFALCSLALRLPTVPTGDALEHEANFPIELAGALKHEFGDVVLPTEYIKLLSNVSSDWDEPMPILSTPEFEVFKNPTSVNYEYDNSTLSRISLLDKIRSSRSKRVMLLSPESFMQKTFIKTLPSSGAVIFVSDHPFHSTCLAVRCPNSTFLDNPRILAVAAENSMCEHPKVSQIPIGLESLLITGRQGSEALQAFQKWTQNPRPASQRRKKVQSDAQLHVFWKPKSGVRNDRYSMVQGVQKSAIDDWYRRKIDFVSHLVNHVSQAKLALCPEGNGIDTHRFYHNYGLRTRCIVRKGALTELHNQFPGTIVVDDWHEVNKENITRWIKEGQATYDPNLLRSDYWINKVLEPHGISLDA